MQLVRPCPATPSVRPLAERNPSSSIPHSNRQAPHTSNWTLHSNPHHTQPPQWPQSSDAPLSAQLALSVPRASTLAPRTLPLPPAAKPTRTPSSRAPARTPSYTYVDNASAPSYTPRKILRTKCIPQCCSKPITQRCASPTKHSQ
jgi:hypothetical protein